MAGAGWDALMIRDADGALKDRLGRVAYVWTGARHLREERFRAVIKVDDKRWFKGKASCVLVGNVGRVFGGIQVFEGAEADDGRLEIGVITAKGPVQWTRAPGAHRGREGRGVAVRRDHHRRARSGSSSTAPFATSSTAATATRSAACASTSNPARSTVCVPEESPAVAP